MKTKILKIIQIVYDILSLAFIVVVIVAMAVTPKSEGHHNYSNNDVNDVVEVKGRYNFYNNGPYYAFGIGDLFNEQFLFGITTQWATYNISQAVVGTTYTIRSFDNVRMVSFSDLNMANLENSYNVGTSINPPTITILEKYDGSAVKNWISYRFTITANNIYSFSFDYTLIFNPSYSADNKPILQYSGDFGYSSGYYLITSNHYFYDYFVQNNNDINSSYQRGYQYGYDVGYDEGSEVGKDEGYNKAVIDITNPDSTTYQYIYDLGKQEGIVEGMRGTESNAFVVIGQAFSAVGSIFSIEVLPNLPLWVLVFTPLIIVVVIVVVKLIKG